MLILKINIDPSTSTMLLDLSVPPQVTPLSAINLPSSLAACNGSSLYSGESGQCSGSYAFQMRGSGGDSMDMNHILLMVTTTRIQYFLLNVDVEWQFL